MTDSHTVHARTEQLPRASERGAVLVILIAMLVALMFLASLAIDSGVLSASRTQHRQTAELLALRAMREYISGTGTPITRLLRARDKAQQLVGIDVFLGQPFRADPSLGDQIGPMDSALTGGPSGDILPGIWHFRPEVDPNTNLCAGASNGCPCTPTGVWNGPCFEPVDFNIASNFDQQGNLIRPINAFRAEYHLRSDSPLRAIFARVKGDASYVVRSVATAAVIPTHGVFLIDLSRSSHLDTHKPYERVGTGTGSGTTLANPTEAAYKLLPTAPSGPTSCTGAAASDPTDPDPDYANPCPLPSSGCIFAGGLFPPDPVTKSGLYDAIYNFTSPSVLIKNTRPTTPAPSSVAVHYKSDYKCYHLQYSEPAAAGLPAANRDEWYLADSFRGQIAGGVSYDGPEPMTTMLDGVHYALELLYQRNIPGDRVGFIGFDESAQISNRRIDLAEPGTAEFRQLERVTDVLLDDAHDSDHDGLNDSAAKRLKERINRMLLLTRVDASANIPSALDQARLMLANQHEPILAENFVALFSDGIANCHGTVGNANSPVTCGRDQNTDVVPAIDQSVNLIQTQYPPAHIKFHMVSIGDLPLPHTLVRKGATDQTVNQCMSDDEARDQQKAFVDLGPDPALNPDQLKNAIMDRRTSPATAAYFYYPNKLYQAAQGTGGIWAPIRPACAPNGALSLPAGTSCGQGGLKQALDQQCAAQSTPGALVPAITGFTDSASRLVCDIYCRSQREQVRAAVDKMFERPPLVLVE